ncbi:hypothetical protein [Xanthocytophaga agilis]|uniref:Uncharacterized protein n=1 Tax=Xanthocytophaga agilis TaxID=3048010 RepID=A0AAE3R616_9BACT|nr:hypothetical protein [Xanthocytophaga agilis]MDJ1502075.1 hypothetical protein [Xanthocytophaga agilis]
MRKISLVLALIFISIVLNAQDRIVVKSVLQTDSIEVLLKLGKQEALQRLMGFVRNEYDFTTDGWYEVGDINLSYNDAMSYPPATNPYTSLKLKAYFWIWLIATSQEDRLIKSEWHPGFLGILISPDSDDKYGIYDLMAFYKTSGRRVLGEDTIEIVDFEILKSKSGLQEKKLKEIDILYFKWFEVFQKNGLSYIQKRKSYPLTNSPFNWQILEVKRRNITPLHK